MNKFRSLSVVAVFLVGCAVGGASSRLAVPPASAQQPTNAVPIAPPGATRWEQMCIEPVGDVAELTGAAMHYGDSYWELVSSSGNLIRARIPMLQAPEVVNTLATVSIGCDAPDVRPRRAGLNRGST